MNPRILLMLAIYTSGVILLSTLSAMLQPRRGKVILRETISDVLGSMNAGILLIFATVASVVILLGILIGLWAYGVDMGHVFIGTPWDSSLPLARGEIALIGGIVAITLTFGGILVGGLIAALKKA